MAGILRRGNTYWVVFYKGGKQIRRSLRTKDKEVALRRKAKVEEALERGEAFGDEAATVQIQDVTADRFWAEYRPWSETRKAKSTRGVEAATWAVFRKLINPTTLGSVTRGRAEAFIADLVAGGAKPATVNGHLRRMRALYNHARELGLYAGKNPFSGIRRVPEPQHPPRFLTAAQIERVMKAAKKHGPNAILLMALGIYAGMRKNEIVNARWEWFDFERRTITVAGERKGGDSAFQPKGRRARVVPMHKRLYGEILPKYRQESGYVLQPDKRPGQRYRYEPRALYEAIRQESGVPFTLHHLRHTFISLLVQHDVSIFKVSQWAGHRDVKVTAQIYAHLQGFDPAIDNL